MSIGEWAVLATAVAVRGHAQGGTKVRHDLGRRPGAHLEPLAAPVWLSTLNRLAKWIIADFQHFLEVGRGRFEPPTDGL